MATGIQIVFRLFDRARMQLLRLRARASQARLAQTKREQMDAFYALRNNFSNIYQKLRKYNTTQYTTSMWENYNAKLEKVFLPDPPFSFLKEPIITETMFGTSGKGLKDTITFLEKEIPSNKLEALLEEDYVGDPLIMSSTYFTSYKSILNLYHLIRFFDTTRCNIDQIATVVEWGGGYGNMAKIFKRLESTPSTYIIIDTPLFSCLQWLYLATILGEEGVSLLHNPEDTIHAEKINILPVCLLDRHKIKGDLFISTWALSESSKFSQDYVLTHKWFSAKYILLTYQDSSNILPEADRVGEIAVSSGAIIQDIEFLPGNHYAFR